MLSVICWITGPDALSEGQYSIASDFTMTQEFAKALIEQHRKFCLCGEEEPQEKEER